ncbi:MAG TPA: CBS domain-containing protein [Longimicrobiaceae bacterium]|nr:CBS domain-containing protein [Longimicrobiaceae bacterium]
MARYGRNFNSPWDFRPQPQRGYGPPRRLTDADRVYAADIMTENPETVSPDTPLAEVATRMRDLDVGIVPVVDDGDGGRLLGLITDRDIAVRAAAAAADMKKATAGDCMTEQVETVTEDDSVRAVFDAMKRSRVRRVPVVDEEGRLTGIIAQADLAVHYAGLSRDREWGVEEVVERISEPARPRPIRHPHDGYDRDFGDRLRHGWQSLRHEASGFFGRGYDRGWR